jgi:hypothetical protein
MRVLPALLHETERNTNNWNAVNALLKRLKAAYPELPEPRHADRVVEQLAGEQ